MRHSTLTIFTVVLSVLVASVALLLVLPGTSEARTPSQGVLVKGPKLPKEKFPPYSKSVDNVLGGKFEAKGWKTSSAGTDIYGKNYLVSRGAKSSAKYEFDIPAKDTYSVFAWWPKRAGAASSVNIKVNTGTKTKTEIVDQSEDGGYWVPIGRYEMKKGERNAVEISAGSGEKVVADAVAVVRGIESFPKDPRKIGDNSERVVRSGETVFSAAGSKRIPRRAIMKRAKARLGQPYDYAHGLCRARSARIDCSCFTKLAYRKWRKLPDSPRRQWYGVRRLSTKFTSKSRLRRGDLVFFDENRNGQINGHDLVAIYAGNGNIIYASGYFGKVVINEMKWINGYTGGKRLRY